MGRRWQVCRPQGLSWDSAAFAAVADLLTPSHSTEMGSSQAGKRRAIFSSPLSLLDHMQIKSWFVKEIRDSDR